MSSLRVSTHQTDTRIPSLTAPPPFDRIPLLSQVPSARELGALGASALASVPSFLVGREGFGSVRWDGPVDLSAVRADDLFDIVRITRGEVAVYDGRASATKPPRGSGLNRPATVTLLGVFPEATERLEAYAKDGSTFVSYDPAAGAWTFRVRHFSRYGMDLDASDSEEEEEDVMEIPEERAARKIESSATRAEDAPFATRGGFGAEDASASELLVPRTPGAATASQAANSEDAFGETRAAATLPRQSAHANESSRGFGGGPAADAVAAAAGARALSAARETNRRGARRRRAPAAATAYAIAASVTGDVGYAKPLDLPLLPLDTKPKLTDAHAFLGASFRPSWGPAGILAHAGRTEAKRVVDAGGYAAASEAAIADQSPHAPCARVVCERFAPRRRSSGDAAALRAALEVALEMTAGDEAGAEDRSANGDARFGKRRRLRCSRLELPGLCDRYMRAVEARLATGPALSLPRALDPSELAMEVSAWDLVKTLWGDEPGGAPGGSAADRHRRRAKLGAWLRKQNGAAFGSGDANEFAVKAATGAPVAATRAAAATGYPRLATLIAQGGCGGAGAALASAQLAVWRGSAVEKYVPAAASSALGVLAGEVAPPRADLPVRDWRVNFGLHVWHGASPTATIARVLDGYLDAVADGAAARPDAPGFSDATPDECSPVDARADRLRETCFNLLVLFATGADALREAGAAGALETRKMFHPLTYCAADLANAAFAWRAFCALRAVGALGDGDDVERLGDELAVRFACQLDGFTDVDVVHAFGSLESDHSEHSSLAEWTVFVLMHVADGPRRAAAVRGALRRRCAEWRSDERKRKFLVERAGAPLAWLEDAEASFLKFHAARYDVS